MRKSEDVTTADIIEALCAAIFFFRMHRYPLTRRMALSEFNAAFSVGSDSMGIIRLQSSKPENLSPGVGPGTDQLRCFTLGPPDHRRATRIVTKANSAVSSSERSRGNSTAWTGRP